MRLSGEVHYCACYAWPNPMPCKILFLMFRGDCDDDVANARVQNLAEKTSCLVDPNFGSCWLPPTNGSHAWVEFRWDSHEIEMLGLFPWRRSFLQTQVSFKLFLKFMLIDDRSAMPTNVLLRKACWSASSARWFGFASFMNLRGSLLFVGYNAELRCGSNEDRFASHRETAQNARINWVIEWNERKCVTEIMRGWFLFRCKLHSKKHTLLRVSFQGEDA